MRKFVELHNLKILGCAVAIEVPPSWDSEESDHWAAHVTEMLVLALKEYLIPLDDEAREYMARLKPQHSPTVEELDADLLIEDIEKMLNGDTDDDVD